MSALPVELASERARHASADPIQPPHRGFITPDGSQLAPKTGLTKIEAETWLDWLEAHGYRGYELAYGPDQGFTVRPSAQSS